MKHWNLQLTSPNGQTFDLGGLGYASSTLEHGYVMPEIRRFLAASNLTQKDFLLSGLQQMLLNSSFYRWHGYRLVWGDASPEDEHVAYPNGEDLKWSLYRLINGKTELLISGCLPSDWWDLDREDRYQLVNAHAQEFED